MSIPFNKLRVYASTTKNIQDSKSRIICKVNDDGTYSAVKPEGMDPLYIYVTGEKNEAHFVPYPYCFRCPYGKKCDSCNYYCVQQLRREFEDGCSGLYNYSTKKSECAAFFVEPVQGSGGYIIPPKGYFKEFDLLWKCYSELLIGMHIEGSR